eukprot:PITA_11935
MVDEMASLHKNEAWDLVELPAGRKPIGGKWVFKKKTNAEGKVEKYKARLVAKEQMDVKTTFLHVDLEEEIYMKQPEAFRSKADHCVYFKLIGDRVIYLVLYVDDMLLVGNDKEIIQDLKTQLSSKFDMKDLGAANYILGMEIKRDRAKRKLWLNQRKYVETILQRFNMQDSKPVKVPIPIGVKLSAEQCPKTQEEEEDMSRVPYASAVGSLMDLRGTSDYGLCYQGRPGLDRVLDIRGFVDADWAGDLDQRRSTSGYVFNLFGGAVSWMSKKQSVVALSTTEAEYKAATHASKEAVWLQRLCSSMGLVQGAIRIDCDSQSAIFLAKNPAYHSQTKYIDVQYHFVRDMIEDKKVLLVKVDTLKNTADAMTKSVSYENFSWCRETMGVSGLEK